jgi:hypothetical protein
MNSIMNVTVRARGLLTLIARFDPGKALEVIERLQRLSPGDRGGPLRPSGGA